ncbi:hypothetical protein L596_012840 [Steinernema carpocapsae]|uniref:Elongin-C n=1 Tax=Steinernema carpocapsae TaxID=34508 RepID=A0A4U5NZ33_STECR|nr:hypothetical protein L596_012840 [Steinernema carpocapsae]
MESLSDEEWAETMRSIEKEIAASFAEDPDAEPPSMLFTPNRFVCLISSDEHRFYIPWGIAKQCKTLQRMARYPHGEEEGKDVIPEYHLIGITSCVLHIVCHYLLYKMVHDSSVRDEFGDVDAMDLSEFRDDDAIDLNDVGAIELNVFHVPDNLLIPVMLAADFLDC